MADEVRVLFPHLFDVLENASDCDEVANAGNENCPFCQVVVDFQPVNS